MPLSVVRLVAAFTHDENRHKRCMEVLRLARHDATSIPSYRPGPEHGHDRETTQRLLEARMVTTEVGRRGGERTTARHGPELYEEIGRKLRQ